MHLTNELDIRVQAPIVTSSDYEFGHPTETVIVSLQDGSLFLGVDAENVVEAIKEHVGKKEMGICPFMDEFAARLASKGSTFRMRTDHPDTFLQDLVAMGAIKLETTN